MTDFTHFWHMPPKKKTCLSIFFSFHQQQECDKAFTVPHLRLLEISIYVSFPHLSPTLGHQTSLTSVPADLKWHLPKKKNCRNSQPMWATVKNPPVTFHYTGWLIGIQIVRYNPTNRFFGSHFLPMKNHIAPQTPSWACPDQLQLDQAYGELRLIERQLVGGFSPTHLKLHITVSQIGSCPPRKSKT